MKQFLSEGVAYRATGYGRSLIGLESRRHAVTGYLRCKNGTISFHYNVRGKIQKSNAVDGGSDTIDLHEIVRDRRVEVSEVLNSAGIPVKALQSLISEFMDPSEHFNYSDSLLI